MVSNRHDFKKPKCTHTFGSLFFSMKQIICVGVEGREQLGMYIVTINHFLFYSSFLFSKDVFFCGKFVGFHYIYDINLQYLYIHAHFKHVSPIFWIKFHSNFKTDSSLSKIRTQTKKKHFFSASLTPHFIISQYLLRSWEIYRQKRPLPYFSCSVSRSSL